MITEVNVVQGVDKNDNHVVTISIIGENKYEETFHDSVYMTGRVHIWWKRKPDIVANIRLSNDNFEHPTQIWGPYLIVDPGGEVVILARWYLYTDDGRSILDMLDFGEPNECDVVFASPEVFVVEVELILFKETGLLRLSPVEFTFYGWKTIIEPI